MKKTKVNFGIPYYGRQDALWWSSFSHKLAILDEMGIEYGGTHLMGAMLTDKNRNEIAKAFLKTDSEWLFWIDADTVVPDGAIRRLLDLDKTLASGLYYGKGLTSHQPIAYVRVPETGSYKPIDKVITWERGEILPIDSCGLGCMLTHRSVFEDISKNYTPYQRFDGGIVPIHNDDVRGKIVYGRSDKSDGLVIQGQLRTRVQPVSVDNPPFPYFLLEFGRTEDMKFFELADRVGHKPWLDTSIECGHLRTHPVEGEDFRKARLHESLRNRPT